MSSTAAEQRRALVSALRQVGPEAPTLCEGWQTRDLATHIVIRDSRPYAMVGDQLPLVGRKARQVRDELAQLSYEALLARVQAGPPRYSPARLSPVADLINTVEFYVHTEDVVRAQSDYDHQHRQDLSGKLRRRLWNHSAHTAFQLAALQRRERITFISPGVGAVTKGRPSDSLVTVQGKPEELVLWAFGRQPAARVEVSEP